jgi:HSP20 family protein
MGRNTRTKRYASRLELIAFNLQELQFARFQLPPSAWQPAINAYLCDGSLVIYAELAGVDAATVSVRVSERQLVITGRRESPERRLREEGVRCAQLLAMEIEHGPFARTLSLPVDVDAAEARVEQTAGLLQIVLPFRSAWKHGE